MVEHGWGLTTTSLRRQQDLRVVMLSENPMLLNTLGVILGAEGFHAVPASNAFDAIRITREHPPLCVLIDLDRNGRDAPTLIRSLRRASDTQPLRVVGLSVDPRDIDLASFGLDAVVAKPLNVDQLVTTLVVQMEQVLTGSRTDVVRGFG